jgi:dihydroneopterin aldolase
LAKGLVELTKNNPVDLLETLAQRLLDYALNFGGGKVLKAKITVHKPGAPIPYEFEDVSITVKAKRPL